MAKVVKKTPVKKKPVVKKSTESTIPEGIKLLKIESGIPIPERGLRDPEFYNSVKEILKNIKPKQSFVIKKSKVHFTLNLVKKEFESYKMKTAVILPDKVFTRIWRVA